VLDQLHVINRCSISFIVLAAPLLHPQARAAYFGNYFGATNRNSNIWWTCIRFPYLFRYIHRNQHNYQHIVACVRPNTIRSCIITPAVVHLQHNGGRRCWTYVIPYVRCFLMTSLTSHTEFHTVLAIASKILSTAANGSSSSLAPTFDTACHLSCINNRLIIGDHVDHVG
jgi:hypothetical protein